MSSPSVIYIGADHAGYALKESVKRHLQDRGIDVEDLGAHVLDINDDYPTYAARVASVVRENPRSLGILVCGSAEGICIAANKFDGIRAGIGFSIPAARSLRNDDDGNVLCLSGRIDAIDKPLMIVDAFVDTGFSGEERHERRVKAISKIEETE